MAKSNRLTRRELDAAAEAAAWYDALRASSNPTFMPLYEDESRYLVLKGGGGSGKSIFAGRKVLERCVSQGGHRLLVCRKVARTIRESCFMQLRSQIAQYYPGMGIKPNLTEMSITFPNGSKILTSGLDDVEKLKSIYEINSVWIEEATELSEADFDQLDIRMRGAPVDYAQMILSFNPVSMTHWIKRRFFDAKMPDARLHESTYLDNPHLPEKNRRVLELFKETNEYYYDVYCLGNWGVTGRSVFNARAVANRLREVGKPEFEGRFAFDYDGLTIKNSKFISEEGGGLEVYREPERGVPYVIGADTAGEGSDQFVAQVLDNRTGEQVARLRQCYDEDEFTHQLYCLGMWYNVALLGVETNFSTFPVRELQRLGYPRQYVRETIDDYTMKPKQAFGFRTDPKTRPVIIATLIRAMRDGLGGIHDRVTLEEMQTFVRNEEYRAEAEDGAHDDCVMALAIAHFIRPHQDYLAAPEPGTAVEWTEDMWEDYRRASADERAMLLHRWGRPKE